MAKAKAVAEKPEPEIDAENGLAKPGHNSGVAADELKAFTERMMSLEDEKKAIIGDMKELRDEIKSRGFDIGAFNAVMKTLKEKAKDEEAFKIKMEMADLYHQALGLY